MQIKPIADPLPGESLIAVAPNLSPEPDVTWNRRLNLHSGRSLSDIALTAEQGERAGRLTLRGQLLAPGVISGLDAGLEDSVEPGDGDALVLKHYVRINPGTGLAASGEIVVLPQPLRVDVNALPVYAPVSVLEGAALPGLGQAVVRKLGDNLGKLHGLGRSLPQAGILVLQPVEIEVTGNQDPQDPCEVDPAAVAFSDRQRVDGCRLVLYAWPTEIVDLPAPGPDPDDALTKTWRNRIAYALFEHERTLAMGQLWPWQELGLAVGVLVFDANLQPLFVDRYSVVRQGGKARRRTPLVAGAGSPELWQARIQQFAEEVTAALAHNQTPADLAGRFFFAPPVGLLPASTLNVAARRFGFFPAAYTVQARPIPLEQLDLAIRESASLVPLQDDLPAQVELLVPVPQPWYEPRLLETETIAAEFDATIATLTAARAAWLARRAAVRVANTMLQAALTGQSIVYPNPDPEALETKEDIQTTPLVPPELLTPFGIATKKDLDGKDVIDEVTKQPVLEIPALEALRALVRNKKLRPFEFNQLDAAGLISFVDFLDQRIRAADDIVDFSFLRVQTDIYRFRQRILGTDEAMRLATSSVLATIAKGDSAYATRQDLQAFLTSAKGKLPPQVPGVNAVQAAAAAGPAPVGDVAPEPQNAPAFGILSNELSVAGARITTPTSDFLGQRVAAQALPTQRAIDLSGVINEVAVSPEVAATIKATQTDAVGKLLDTNIVALRPPSQNAIIEQSPIIGQVYDFRTSVIAERISDPPSGEARLAAIATKYTTIQAVQAMSINVDDILVPGFLQDGDANKPLIALRLDAIDEAKLRQVLQGLHDTPRNNGERDADYFNSGIKALENTAGLLRGLEGRIQTYRDVLNQARDTLNTIQAFAASVDSRLKAIGNALAEARHDVAVAKALRAEEQARINNINTRRAAILQNQVPFVCFRRPRVAPTIMDAPARVIDAGFAEPVVTTCLNSNVNTPAEIQRFVDLMRRAPLRWFSDFGQLLNLLDRQQSLLAALQAAKAAAVYRQLQVTPQFALPFLANASFTTTALASQSTNVAALRVADGIGRVFAAQEQAIVQIQAQIASLNLGDLAGLSWQNVRDQARSVVTIGDLIDANHGNSQVSQRAAAALNNIAQVATCLYAEVSKVPAIVRLAWAELLSQYDAPVGLRNLANLPRWAEVPELRDRREMQSLVDWLFARINPDEPDAVGLINDLIRVCILLASHAPVNQIIAGALHETVTARPGSFIKIAIDPALVRIGMPVAVYNAQAVVAHAVVTDLSGGLAAAQIIKTVQPTVQLDKGFRVQFGAVIASAVARVR